MTLGYAVPETEVRAYLSDSETLLWAGTPGKGSGIGWSFLPQSLFGLFFSGFAIFWMSMAASGAKRPPGPMLFFPLFGLPFLCVGLYMAFGSIFVDSYRRKRMVYAITDQRLLIVSGGKTRVTRSIPLDRVGEVETHQRPDGSGDIYLQDVAGVAANFGAGRSRMKRGGPGGPGPFVFQRVTSVRDVERQIYDARNEIRRKFAEHVQ